MFQYTVQTKSAVDSRGRYQVLFRPNFARLASGSRSHGSSHSPKVAESRVYGKTRPSRNHGWDSTRRNYLTCAFQLRAGWTRAALEGKVSDKKAPLLLRR